MSKAAAEMFIKKYHFQSQDLVFLYNISTEWHHHPCIQVCISLHPDHLIKLEALGNTYKGHGFLIRSNVPHKLDVTNTCCFSLLIFPTDPNYHLFNHLTNQNAITVIKQSEVHKIAEQLIKPLISSEINALSDYYTDLMNVFNCDCHTDTRILKATSIMAALPIKQISSRDLASQIYLSESRFLHLFRDQLDINFRAYLLWLRVNDAIAMLRDTVSLTATANGCGFADSAHFSRTCKKTYGLRPSYLKRAIEQTEQTRCQPIRCLSNLLLHPVGDGQTGFCQPQQHD